MFVLPQRAQFDFVERKMLSNERAKPGTNATYTTSPPRGQYIIILIEPGTNATYIMSPSRSVYWTIIIIILIAWYIPRGQCIGIILVYQCCIY